MAINEAAKRLVYKQKQGLRNSKRQKVEHRQDLRDQVLALTAEIDAIDVDLTTLDTNIPDPTSEEEPV
ncbi:hypothetical protein LCGC14_1852390 [marine sediment metagenome]|uniref:Uncharacterized protein n=1 Tax=marine sediment metagenome TaxID=412755 RepID=A0A0F9G9X5_9ZZZZ